MNLRLCALLFAAFVFTSLSAHAVEPCDGGGPPPKKNGQVVAKLKSGQQKWELTPNSLGIFPVVITKTNTPVEFEIRYPNVTEGALAVVSVRDGGKVSASVTDDGKGKGGRQTVTGPTVRPRLGNNGKLEFTFLYGLSQHYQRVTVDIGRQQYVFEFHVDH